MVERRVLRGFRAWALVTLCAAAGAACGDGDDTESCFVRPKEGETSAAGTLIYSVNGSALAKVSKIVYAAPDGEKKIENPQLPFSVSLKVGAGASMRLEVTGSADQGGSLMAGYSFIDAAMTSSVLESDSCQR